MGEPQMEDAEKAASVNIKSGLFVLVRATGLLACYHKEKVDFYSPDYKSRTVARLRAYVPPNSGVDVNAVEKVYAELLRIRYSSHIAAKKEEDEVTGQLLEEFAKVWPVYLDNLDKLEIWLKEGKFM